jgi:2,4-dienoyl-CoA reductase-like NADH-dependent reductase (Old Yellow Enzyme family)
VRPLRVAAAADGVEIHGANGDIVQQFLSDNANQRTDAYGGSIEKRSRFAIRVATAVAAEIGADRTGSRISPGGTFNDIVENDPHALYRHLVPQLAALDLAYLHVLHAGDEDLLRAIREAWPTSLIVNRAGRPREQIAVDVDNGLADAASVASFALANPDLVARLKNDSPPNEADTDTFYGSDEHGYTDYPTLLAALTAEPQEPVLSTHEGGAPGRLINRVEVRVMSRSHDKVAGEGDLMGTAFEDVHQISRRVGENHDVTDGHSVRKAQSPPRQ